MATINILPPNPARLYERDRSRGILKIERTAGDGSPNTADTYTIFYTDATTSTYQVWNGRDGVDGADGEGAGLGTVTSVGMTVPAGLVVAGSPVTVAGVLELDLADGYVIPTSAQLAALAPLVDGVETVSSTSPTLGIASGAIKTWTLTANSTLALSLGSGESITLHVKRAAFTLKLPGVRWPDGAEPTLHATDENVIEFWAVGAVVYGAHVGMFPGPVES